MITGLQRAVYKVLAEATDTGEPLAGVPQILDHAMEMVEDGGISVETAPEEYSGGSENRRDFCTGEIRVHCVKWLGRGRDYQAALADADALAKKVRQVLKGNLILESAEFPDGFTSQSVRILRTDTGFGVHGGTRVAVATVVIKADYEESFS